jgi:hypothetical protein
LRLLYALADKGSGSLFVRARTSIVMEAHEYVCPQRLLGQWNTQRMQQFLKGMSPRRQYW